MGCGPPDGRRRVSGSHRGCRGVLNQALRDASAAAESDQPRREENVLGESFALHLTMPAEDAATLVSANAW